MISKSWNPTLDSVLSSSITNHQVVSGGTMQPLTGFIDSILKERHFTEICKLKKFKNYTL